MTSKRIYVARLLTERAMDTLRGSDWDLDVGDEAPPSRDQLLSKVRGTDAAVVTLTERIDAQFFDAAGPCLKVVANVAVGYDNIDVEEADRRGVTVTNTPGVLDDATADHTFALILDLARRVTEADRFVRSQTPWVWGPRMLVGLDISGGARLGIVGLGRIGRAVARRAKAFSMDVVAYDPHGVPGDFQDDVSMLPLHEVLATSDVVSLHVPLLPSTHHLMNAETLAKMKPDAYLVNVARGGVVDESALIQALRTGALRGAAIDTFEGEPQVNPELLGLDNVVLTPHIASAGDRTRDRMCLLALENVERVLSGQAPVTPVAPRVLA
ncbi:D-glycerate dehydrogenase [Georgenia sp. TF02-10]|uniref:2-hydroxyacid dehydrogenase n=1 Tax=Georgenia sp. TF02-10 TaxID=2917725 RepID=UPI001FA6FD9A|nr:D-glycerate dehydrogenase [Georgenia sp. TF02-10]UNX55387.1 D-glycerate dehydrogenase [Georgenia sp. TF02-10]